MFFLFRAFTYFRIRNILYQFKINMAKSNLLLLALLVTVFQAGMAQWQQTAGPNGGSMQEIVQVETTLVVSASNGGLYKSENNGDSWELSTNGLPVNPSVQALVESNGVLYCSIAQRGLYKSEDKAVNWEPINSGIETMTFYSILADGNNLYAGNANGGIYYSNDGGVNWSPSEGEISSIQFQDFEIFNSNVYAGGTTLFESSDNGATWEEVVIPGLGPNGIRSMVADNGVFYAADDGRVFVSSNMTDWTLTPLNTSATIVSMTAQDNRVYASTSNGRYFYADNAGSSWTLVQNANTNSFVRYVLLTGGKIIMSTDEGLYESVDSGTSWTFASNGINSVSVTAIFGYDDTLFAGTQSKGIYRSMDNGDTWIPVNNGLTAANAYTIYEILEVTGTLYIATGGGIYESTDEGDSWIRKLDPGINMSTQVLAYDNGVFVSGPSETSTGIYLSINGTDTWSSIPIDGLDQGTSFESIVLEGNTIVVSTAGGELFLTHDLGGTWENISIPNANAFYFTYDLKLVNGILYAGTARGLLATVDWGEKWVFVIEETRQIFDLEVNSDIIYAATDQGFFITENNLFSWYDLSDGMGNQALNTLFFKGEEVFAGAFASSVWKLPIQEAMFPDDDSDSDGVPDYRDNCLNTTAGVEVNDNGCESVLPEAVFVYGESETCPDTSNGTIRVTTTLANRLFNIEVSRGSFNLEFLNVSISDVFEIGNLAAANYLVTVSIPSIAFEKGFGVTINEYQAITGKRQSINRIGGTVKYKVSGSTEYIVTVNGEEKSFFFDSVSENEINLYNLKDYNRVSISGKSECQGTISDSFATVDELILHPTITSGQVNVDGDYDDVVVRVFDFSGRLILEKTMLQNNNTSFDLNSFGPGIYPVQITSNGKTQTFKVIKQ